MQDGLSDAYVARAILDIQRLKSRYFRLVDTRDWPGLSSLFTSDAQLWFAEHESRPLTFAEALENNIKRILEGATSVHHGHVPEIELQSETEATGIWPMESRLYWPSTKASIGLVFSHGYGHYHEQYRRESEGWRISSLKLTQLWKQVIPVPITVT